MDEDWLVTAIVGADTSVKAVRRALDKLAVALDELLAARADGASTLQIGEGLSTGLRDAQTDAAVAFRNLERAVSSLRAAAVRELIDDEAMTLAELARVWGMSRHALSRLYHYKDATEPGGPAEPAPQ